MTHWRKASDTAIVRSGQTIAKYVLDGSHQYALYGSGPDMIGHWPTADQAKEAAERIRASIAEEKRIAA